MEHIAHIFEHWVEVVVGMALYAVPSAIVSAVVQRGITRRDEFRRSANR